MFGAIVMHNQRVRERKLAREIIDREAQEVLALSIEAFKRGLMFPLPQVLGMTNAAWIEAAKRALSGENASQGHTDGG